VESEFEVRSTLARPRWRFGLVRTVSLFLPLRNSAALCGEYSSSHPASLLSRNALAAGNGIPLPRPRHEGVLGFEGLSELDSQSGGLRRQDVSILEAITIGVDLGMQRSSQRGHFQSCDIIAGERRMDIHHDSRPRTPGMRGHLLSLGGKHLSRLDERTHSNVRGIRLGNVERMGLGKQTELLHRGQTFPARNRH